MLGPSFMVRSYSNHRRSDKCYGGTWHFTRDRRHGHHLLHPLRDRSVPAPCVRRVRASVGADHPALRRRSGGLFPAARRDEQRRLGTDRVREPRSLRGVPSAASRRPGRPREFRVRASEAADPPRGAHVPAGGGRRLSRPGGSVGSARMIAVIFEVVPNVGQKDAYLDAAAALRPLLDRIDGFISIERFASLTEPGKILSLSYWRDEEAVRRWRNVEAHRAIQKAGRTSIFADYRLRVAHVVRDYGMNDRRQAPADSREVHGN